MKKLLITGGTGFFGKSILDYLNENNSDFDVTIVSRKGMNTEKYRYLNINQILGDIRKIELDDYYDYIIHAAAPAVVDISDNEMHSIIINGMNNLIEQINRFGRSTKILFTSSGAVYGDYGRLVSEKDECHPKSVYGVSKLEAEKLLLDSGLNCNIARCFAFSGKNLNQSIHFAVGNFIKNARDNVDIIIKSDGSSIRSYLDQYDLTEWLIKILVYGKNKEIYNVGSSNVISIKDLAYFIQNKFNKNIDVKILGNNSLSNTKSFYAPNIDKVKKELGCVQTIGLEQSLRQMYNI